MPPREEMIRHATGATLISGTTRPKCLVKILTNFRHVLNKEIGLGASFASVVSLAKNAMPDLHAVIKPGRRHGSYASPSPSGSE